MRATVSTDLLLRLFQATPEQYSAIERILYGAGTETRKAESKKGTHTSSSPIPGKEREAPPYVFRWTGRDWEVVANGGKPFYLEDTLGARYLNYLLHRPNEPIAAFDLEVAIMPEKGEARSRNSIQPGSDLQALREYRQELGRLGAERQMAHAAGDQEGIERLDDQIEALESALKGGGVTRDTGERARSNVRLATRAVTTRLRKGGIEGKAFAEHLERHLRLGGECLYSQPQGRIWG